MKKFNQNHKIKINQRKNPKNEKKTLKKKIKKHKEIIYLVLTYH
jgi:hypothetical protein